MTEQATARTFQGTPGPWGIEEVWSGPASERGLVYARIHSDKSDVGFAGAYLSRHGKPDDEARANARLIAAAPALLEALTETLGDLRAFKREDIEEDWASFATLVQDARNRCEAAIDKALGVPS